MTSATPREKALRLRALHHGPAPLLLPNVWDAASARVVAACGAPALATSSAAVAFMLGYPDGQVIPRGEMLAVVPWPTSPAWASRVSPGSATQRAAMGLLRRIATEVFGAGTFAHATEGAIPYAEMNDLLRG